jgi:hypothetical protein
VSSLATVAALVGIATAAIIYGTDIFSALVLRPAALGAAEASVADLLGRVRATPTRRTDHGCVARPRYRVRRSRRAAPSGGHDGLADVHGPGGHAATSARLVPLERRRFVGAGVQSAQRQARIQANPRSSLHLNDDGEEHDFVVLTGTIKQAPGTPPAHKHPAYAGKYATWMARVFGSAERFSSMFSVPLLFRATRIRGG